jgi:hypothetical protein
MELQVSSDITSMNPTPVAQGAPQGHTQGPPNVYNLDYLEHPLPLPVHI